MPEWNLRGVLRLPTISGTVAVAGDVQYVNPLTNATLSGPSAILAGVANTYAVTLNVAALQTYVVTPSCPGATVSPGSFNILAGATSGTFTVTAPSAGAYSVDFTISPTLTRFGRPLAVTATVQIVAGLAFESTTTPEQIGIYMPLLRAAASTTTAGVRYRQNGTVPWFVAHPLLRIQTTGNETDGPTTLVDAFSGSIFDLSPGVLYDVEATIVEAGQPNLVLTSTRLTRALPAVAGGGTDSAISVATITTKFAGFTGSVLVISDGVYDVSGLVLSAAGGTAGAPKYIRGTSRTGTVLRNISSTVLTISTSHVVLENLTIQGSGVDAGGVPSPSSVGIVVNTSSARTNITLRNLNMVGVDIGVKAQGAITGALIYECDIRGNNTWDKAYTAPTNQTWNDDGVLVPGFGNCVWNNTINGFGDTFSIVVPGSTTDRAEGIYFYRNRILNNGDDLIEFDYGTRNIALYDSVITNTATVWSSSYQYGGPTYFFRNVCVNTFRGPFKGNAAGVGITGFLIYNNTIVRTDGTGFANDGWGWYQTSGNGAWQNYSYRNNLLVYRGSGSSGLLQMGAGDDNPCDFDYNAWFPDGSIYWASTSPTTSASLAATKTKLAAQTVTPLFGSSQRMVHDVLTVTNPFVTVITLGASHTTEYTAVPDATLSASGPKGLGVAIPGITDGFSDGAPDIGAVITGRAQPSIGAAATIFPVSADATGRYLKQANGTPFPILGRTSWALISLAQAAQRSYIDDCVAKGYNAIEVAIPHHWNSFSSTPSNQPPRANNGALLPFTNRLDGATYNGEMGGGTTGSPNFTTLSEPYWQFADALLDYAESKGVLCLVFLCYNGAGGGPDGWMQEMISNGTTRMQQYGAAVGARWASKRNIVWMLAGDYGGSTSPYQGGEGAIEDAFITGLTGVAKVCNFYSAELPSNSTSRGPNTTALLQSTINLNGSYSWQGQSGSWARTAYIENAGPAFLLEEPYDQEGPDGNNINGNATQPVRRFQYWGWMNTIGGYMSGNGYVWPFLSTYSTHLNTVGAQDMARLNTFIKSIEWWRLVPNGLGGTGVLLTFGTGSIDTSGYCPSAATRERDLLLVYMGLTSTSVTVDMTKLQGTVTARWWDPTSGAYTAAGTFPNTGTQAFSKPGNNSAGEGDWMLRLDAATALPTYLQSLALFTWLELPGTAGSNAGMSTSDNRVGAWCGAAYDTIRGRILFTGGGHQDSDDNAMYGINLRVNTPNIQVLSTASASQFVDPALSYNSGGKPNARHTYWHVTYVPQCDRFFELGALSLYPGGNVMSDVKMNGFNCATNTWDSQPNGAASNPWPDRRGSAAQMGNSSSQGSCVDPTGNVYTIDYHIDGGIGKWTRNGATGSNGIWGSWARLGSWGGAPKYCHMQYDISRDRIMVWGTGTLLNPTTGAITDISFTGAQAGIAGGDNVHWVDSQETSGTVADRFIGFRYEGNGSSILGPAVIYTCQKDTPYAITTLPIAGTPPNLNTASGNFAVYGRFGIDTTLGICWLWPNPAYFNVFVFRYK